MHKLAQHVGGCVKAFFYWYNYCQKSRKKTILSTDIGGARIFKIPESDYYEIQLQELRILSMKNQKKKVLKKIDEFKLEDNKGCCILGIAGSGKSGKCKILRKELGEGKYMVAAPTHKAALLIGAVTVYNLFNMDTHKHTYLKSAVEKLQNSGVEWIFINEIIMINSKVWGELIIKKIKKNIVLNLY
jgi:hypothetical protein